MSFKRKFIFSLVALAGMAVMSSRSEAFMDDATILIDRALNSPVITVRYSGAVATTVELLVNGKSFGKRSVSTAQDRGETNFTLDLSALNDGDNQIEIRLIDKNGKIVGSEKSVVTTDERARGPVFLSAPKMGATVNGPVEIRLGFGKEMKNIYVSFFIDSQFKMMSNFAPYSYLWDTTRETNGWHDLEAWVVDDMSDTLKTRKVKVFVNNPGGNTTRRRSEVPTTPARKPESVPMKPASAPLDLKLSTNAMNSKVGLEAGVRGSSVQPGKVAPVVVKPAIPVNSLLQPLFNVLLPLVAGASDTKAHLVGTTTAAGAKYLTPSGSRLAAEPTSVKATPSVAGATSTKPSSTVAGNAPAQPKPALSEPKSEPVSAMPATVTAAPVAKVEPKPETLVKPVEKTEPKAELKPAAKPIAKPEPRVVAAPAPVPVTIGTKLPVNGTFSIILNSKPLMFGDVQPRTVEGVPLTPFRYLFEQAGGEVNWSHEYKIIEARGDENNVYLKMGDVEAKVNALPVKLEVAPFIDRGRAIVPLSFLNSALNISIDFDPASGHVLIKRKSK